MRNSKVLIAATAAALIGGATPAWAADGCKVLLCLAGPWQSIAACISEVEQLFQDLWKGEPFPSCGFASGTPYAQDLPSGRTPAHASAANTWLAQWAPAADPNCPRQYVTTFPAKGRTMYACEYVGMITVQIDGAPWSRTYWSTTGGSVTELAADAPLFAGMRSAQGIADSRVFRAAQAPVAARVRAQASGGGGE
jgi:hypothetical protein